MIFRIPELQLAPPPSHFIYRVAGTRRRDSIPFNPLNPAPWGSQFKGRFDDPRISEDGHDTGGCFRVVYFASRLVGAFGEKIQEFMPDPEAMRKYFQGTPPYDPDLLGTRIPRGWSNTYWIGKTLLHPELRLLDLYETRTHRALNIAEELEPYIVALEEAQKGILEEGKKEIINVSTLTGRNKVQRELTRQIALYAYQQFDSFRRPRFHGIRYMSHLNPQWECWAVFHDRIMHSPEPPQGFTNAHPDLKEAADHLAIYVD